MQNSDENQIKELKDEILKKIEFLIGEAMNINPTTKEQLDEYRVKWLGKKGYIMNLFECFRYVSPEMKREMGLHINNLKKLVQRNISKAMENFTEIK